MPTRLRRILLTSMLATACNDNGEPEPEPEPEAALPEVCGAPGPARVLALMPTQTLMEPPRQIGERVFYRVGEPLPEGRARPFMSFGLGALWATGPCGESPTPVPGYLPFELDRWPGVALVCDYSTRTIVSLAPTGPLAPHVVFSNISCDPTVSEHGLIDDPGAAGGEHSLMLHPWPEDPRTQTSEPAPLTDVPIRVVANRMKARVVGEHLFAITNLQELVHIDLISGELTVERTDIGEFMVSPDARYLLTWGVEDSPHGTTDAVMLYDRETGVSVVIGTGHPQRNPDALRWIDQGRILLDPVKIGENWRVVGLPGPASVEVPAGNLLDGSAEVGRSVDGRWILQSTGGGPLADDRWVLQSLYDGMLRYLDLSNGATTLMFPRPAQVVARDEAGAVVLQSPLCCTWAQVEDEGPLWSVPYDGSSPQLLSPRSTVFTYRPNDHQLLTLVDIDDSRLGSLVLIDRELGTERTIDEQVTANYPGLSVGPDSVRYSVQDGERSGVWLARLP